MSTEVQTLLQDEHLLPTEYLVTNLYMPAVDKICEVRKDIVHFSPVRRITAKQ